MHVNRYRFSLLLLIYFTLGIVLGVEWNYMINQDCTVEYQPTAGSDKDVRFHLGTILNDFSTQEDPTSNTTYTGFLSYETVEQGLGFLSYNLTFNVQVNIPKTFLTINCSQMPSLVTNTCLSVSQLLTRHWTCQGRHT